MSAPGNQSQNDAEDSARILRWNNYLKIMHEDAQGTEADVDDDNTASDSSIGLSFYD